MTHHTLVFFDGSAPAVREQIEKLARESGSVLSARHHPGRTDSLDFDYANEDEARRLVLAIEAVHPPIGTAISGPVPK